MTVAAAVAALAVAISLPTAAGSPAAGELCKLSGTRYAGKTSQGKSMCFTLTRSGKISEYAYAVRNTCGGVTSRTTSKTGIAVSGAGSFSTTFQGSFFKGKISGRKASGTLRSKTTQYGFVPPVTCDSGVVKWNATKR
jgi:hypothetical protein